MKKDKQYEREKGVILSVLGNIWWILLVLAIGVLTIMIIFDA